MVRFIKRSNIWTVSFIGKRFQTISTLLQEKNSVRFQQDGAATHSIVKVWNYLTNLFNGRWVGTFSEYALPVRLRDLTPLHFFLWGYLINEVIKMRLIYLLLFWIGK